VVDNNDEEEKKEEQPQAVTESIPEGGAEESK